MANEPLDLSAGGTLASKSEPIDLSGGGTLARGPDLSSGGIPSGDYLDSEAEKVYQFVLKAKAIGGGNELEAREAASNWLEQRKSGMPTRTVGQFMEDRAKDEDLFTMSNAKIAGHSLKDGLLSIAKGGAKAGWQSFKSFSGVNTLMIPEEIKAQGPEVMQQWRNEVESQNIQDQIAANKAMMEGVAQTYLSLADLGKNAVDEIAEFTPLVANEEANEFMRMVRSQQLDKKFQKDGVIFDPKELDQDQVAFGSMLAPVGGLGLVKTAAQSGKLGRPMQLLSGSPQSLGRISLKVGGKATELGLKGVRKGVVEPLEVISRTAGKSAALPRKALQKFKLPGGVALGVGLSTPAMPVVLKTLGTMAAVEGVAKTASTLAKGTGWGMRKAESFLNVAARPDRQKRLLDILATEHGSKAAAILSKFGGTKMQDFAMDTIFTGVAGGAIEGAMAALQQRENEDIARAAGSGAGIGAIVGGVFGERGSGASTQLIDPVTGKMTSRSKGSFELAENTIEARRSEALGQLDQSNKLKNMPDAVKAALGEAQELGILPQDVILLDPKDFGAALQAMNRSGLHARFDNEALYFENENVLLLNADANLEGVGGLRVMGEELAHTAMRKAFDDPSVLGVALKPFMDENGRAMPMDRASQSTQTVKVNKELSKFVDAYNKEAAASGSPMLTTARQALMEFYGANAGLDMSSNRSQFANTSPLWYRKAMNDVRRMTLGMMGKQPRDNAQYASSIDRAANTPTGRYVREQYKIWRQELVDIRKSTDDILNKRSNLNDVKTPDDAVSALNKDSSVTGAVNKAPVKLKRVRKPRKGDLLKQMEKQGIGEPTRGGRVIRGRIPQGIKDEWANQFPKSDRAAALQWLDQQETTALNRQASVFVYETTTGKNASKVRRRYAIPEGTFRVNKDNQIFLNMRDMDAIDGNIKVAMQEGRTGNKSEMQVRNEVLADLDAFERDPKHKVQDQTRAIMGERRKRDGKELEGAWQGWNVSTDRRPIKDFDVDGLMGYADAEGNALFGQPRAQEGLVFANPRRVQVELSPQAKDLLAPINKSMAAGREKLIRKEGDITVLDAEFKPAPDSISRRYLKGDSGVLQVFSTDGNSATISNAFVKEGQQGKGIASELLSIARQDFDTVSHSDVLSDSGAAFANATQ